MEFECKACGAEYELIHTEDDKPDFCPFCGVQYEDVDTDEEFWGDEDE